MHDSHQTVSLPLVLSNLRRHRVVVVMTVLLAVGVSLALSAAADPRYTAKSVVGFNDESADLQALGTPASPNFQPDKLAAAQAERITRPDVIARVRERVRTDMTANEIQDAVSTQVEAASNLVSITVEADSAELAAALANGFAAAIRADTRDRSVQRYTAAARVARRKARKLKGQSNLARRVILEDQASRLLTLATLARPVDVVRTAEPPSSPSSPKPVRNAILAGLIGLILGVGIAFFRETLDRRLREPADVEEALGLPVVGVVPTAALGGTPLLTAKGKEPTEIDVEPFKILRTNVGYLSMDDTVRVVAVTSPLPEEGKSTVAVGLAWAEAKAGRRTLLVDCDLRRPTIAGRLGFASRPGLSDYLVGDAAPADVLTTVELGTSSFSNGAAGAQLTCIPAGRSVETHAELLASPRFREFLAQVSQVYDRVVLDTAPLLPVSDTLGLLPHVDAILLCTRIGQTTRDEALAARTALEHLPTKATGLVITAADRGSRPYYVGSYAYDRVAQEVG